MDGKDMTFNVTIKFANELDMSWLRNVKPGLRDNDRQDQSLQALNVILSMAAVANSIPVKK